MLSIDAEREAEEVGLHGATAQAIVWKVAKLVGLQIQHGERLFLSGPVSAIAAVQQNCEMSVRRNGHCCREIIDLSRSAGHFSKHLAVGHRGLVGRRGLLGAQSPNCQHNQQDDVETTRKIRNSHPGIIGEFWQIKGE